MSASVRLDKGQCSGAHKDERVYSYPFINNDFIHDKLGLNIRKRVLRCQGDRSDEAL